MQSKIYTLAFDVEGTLLDKKGNLDPDVVDIFNKAEKSKTNFVFLTGNNYRVAQCVLARINEISEGYRVESWVAANGGSTIYAPNGLLVREYSKTLPTEKLQSIIDTARAIDPKCIFMYSNVEENYIEKQNKKDLYNYTMLEAFKRNDKKKGDISLDLKEIEGVKSGRKLDEILAEIGEINQFFISSLNKDKQAQIYNALNEKFEGEYSVYLDGKYIAIPAQNKLQALQKIVELDHFRSRPVLPTDYREIVYFGDGVNDVECLKNCNVSVARGKYADELAKKSSTFKITNLTNFADSLYNGAYDELIEKNREHTTPRPRTISIR